MLSSPAIRSRSCVTAAPPVSLIHTMQHLTSLNKLTKQTSGPAHAARSSALPAFVLKNLPQTLGLTTILPPPLSSTAVNAKGGIIGPRAWLASQTKPLTSSYSQQQCALALGLRAAAACLPYFQTYCQPHARARISPACAMPNLPMAKGIPTNKREESLNQGDPSWQ